MEVSILLAHMDDLANKATKIGFTASKFLTPAEAQIVTENFTRRHDITLTPDGGFEGAERIRMIFTNPDWGSYVREELLSALKIEHRPQDSLGHRDILGALMAVGIERETIGDILVTEQITAFVCMPELSGYITGNIFKAGRVGIKISEIDLKELPARIEELTIISGTVASLRLDAVLSVAFRLSRSKITELIAAGRVSLNHQVCLQSSKGVGEQSLLSIRGMGRAKLLEVGGATKKGRIFIKIGLYGR
jgi:RNA-binding protein YlmH